MLFKNEKFVATWFCIAQNKPEQQKKPATQAVKTKKRQAVTPAADFQDSDQEDEYDKG